MLIVNDPFLVVAERDEQQDNKTTPRKLVRTPQKTARDQSSSGGDRTPKDIDKETFMKKNFNLLTPTELQETNKRRSARVSLSEQQKQVRALSDKSRCLSSRQQCQNLH